MSFWKRILVVVVAAFAVLAGRTVPAQALTKEAAQDVIHKGGGDPCEKN